MAVRRVGYVVNAFPKLSETFIAREVAQLLRCEIDVRILSLRTPAEPWCHEFVTRAGLYLSPVMWTVEMVPPGRGEVALYNPMTVPISMIRNGITGQPLGIESPFLTYSIVVCAASFLLGVMTFQRYEAEAVKKL